MYKIKAMNIKDYKEIVNLCENTEGVILHYHDDSKKIINKFWEKT
jgi:hypothetical protein